MTLVADELAVVDQHVAVRRRDLHRCRRHGHDHELPDPGQRRQPRRLGGGGLTCTCTDVELRQVTIARNTAQSGAGLLYHAPSGPSDGLRVVNSQHPGQREPRRRRRGGAGWRKRRDRRPADERHDLPELRRARGPTAGLEVGAGPGAVTVTDSVIGGNIGPEALADCGGPITTAGVVFVQFSVCTSHVRAGDRRRRRGPEHRHRRPARPRRRADGPADDPRRVAAHHVPGRRHRAVHGRPSPRTSRARPDRTAPAATRARSRPTGSICACSPRPPRPPPPVRASPSSSLPPSAVRPKTGSTATSAGGVAGQAIRANDLQASPIGRITLGDLPIGRIAADADALGADPAQLDPGRRRLGPAARAAPGTPTSRCRT